MPTAVEEMLRWVTPIKNMNRTATRDVEVGGQQIREGDNVLLLYPSANRDEAVFADPHAFDLARTPNDHVAFGFGTHFCLGNSLARLELRVMFEELLDRLPDLELVDLAEPARRPANFVSGYESMPVRFTPTAPSTARSVAPAAQPSIHHTPKRCDMTKVRGMGTVRSPWRRRACWPPAAETAGAKAAPPPPAARAPPRPPARAPPSRSLTARARRARRPARSASSTRSRPAARR
ncbi:MAG: cytochrome P450 [Acidimicrobiales bacterium]